MGTFDTLNLHSLQLGEISISSRGAKTCPLTSNNQPIQVQLVGVRTPFGTNSWEPSDRQNLEYSLDTTTAAAVALLDEWVVQTVVQRSEQLFGKPLTQEQVMDKMKCSVTQAKKGDFKPTLRSKINLAGTKIVRVWTLDGNPRGMPEDLRTCQITANLHIRSLWFMGPSFGITFETSDLQVCEEAAMCPFPRSPFSDSGPH